MDGDDLCIYEWLKSYLDGGGAYWWSDEGVGGERVRDELVQRSDIA